MKQIFVFIFLIIQVQSVFAENNFHQVKSQMTNEEQDIYLKGEMDKTKYIVGGVLGTYPIGLGIGHAIQGRYSEKGWIFTAGELGAMAVSTISLVGCFGEIETNRNCNLTPFVIGVYGYLAFRILELFIDFRV